MQVTPRVWEPVRATRSMQMIKRYFWPVIGAIAVLWSVKILYDRLRAEACIDALLESRCDAAGLFERLALISGVLSQKLAAIPLRGYLLAALSTFVAYAALAWYDRIALMHLHREKKISWAYVSLCSFVTYALSHNIGASVVSGGMVRLRAYTAKGLKAAEVAVLVAMCSFTFAFGVVLLGGLLLIYDPDLADALYDAPRWMARLAGLCMVGFCCLYGIGSWFRFKPVSIRGLTLEYPSRAIVIRQFIAGPLELLGAAGIIYFALPGSVNPGFIKVLGAFLLSFSAGLLAQVPGGVGVMEAVFLKVMPEVSPASVFAALLVWRLLYLVIPLALSIPVVAMFERSQLGKASREDKNQGSLQP